MSRNWHEIRKTGQGCLAVAGLLFLLLALVWPSFAEHVFRSRLAVVSIGLLIIVLNPALRAGLTTGSQEFLRATAEVAEEIRRAIDGDDDDGPRTT